MWYVIVAGISLVIGGVLGVMIGRLSKPEPSPLGEAELSQRLRGNQRL